MDSTTLAREESFRQCCKKSPFREARILAALLQFSAGLDRSQLTVLTTYKRSTRDRYVQYLKEKGLPTDSN